MNLRAIATEPAKPLHEMEMHEIIGRKFEKKPLMKPDFDNHENLQPEVSHGSLKGLLEKLSKSK